MLSVERPAMLELLHLVCDVAVELGEDLHIAEHAPKLAALLAISASKRLDGKNFKTLCHQRKTSSGTRIVCSLPPWRGPPSVIASSLCQEPRTASTMLKTLCFLIEYTGFTFTQ